MRYASCAIADGLPWCWGRDTHGEVGVNAGIGTYVTPTQIASVGVWHQLRQTKEATCALVGTQRWCWGDGADYGLGNNATGNVVTPVAADALAWDRVSLGDHFGCGISDGPKQMWCWGSDESQTQNDGATQTTAMIPHTLGSPTYTRVAASWSGDHVCAIASGGALWCWGANNFGQCGVTAGSTPLAVPTWIDTGTWQELAAGPFHTCATKDDATDSGQLWCWGAHTDKQLGLDRNVAYEDTPQRIGTELEWTAVTAGTWHTCGLRGGNLYCWGVNVHGQLGVGTSAHNTPVAVGFP